MEEFQPPARDVGQERVALVEQWYALSNPQVHFHKCIREEMVQAAHWGAQGEYELSAACENYAEGLRKFVKKMTYIARLKRQMSTLKMDRTNMPPAHFLSDMRQLLKQIQRAEREAARFAPVRHSTTNDGGGGGEVKRYRRPAEFQGCSISGPCRWSAARVNPPQ